MNNAMNTGSEERDLAPTELDAVSGGTGLSVTFSVTNQEWMALSHKLSEVLKSHQEDALGNVIKQRFQAGFGQ